MALDNFPCLAGLSDYYLRKQLQDFRSGSRKQGTMQPLSYGLNDQQIADVAAYYSTVRPPRLEP